MQAAHVMWLSSTVMHGRLASAVPGAEHARVGMPAASLGGHGGAEPFSVRRHGPNHVLLVPWGTHGWAESVVRLRRMSSVESGGWCCASAWSLGVIMIRSGHH